MSETPHCWTGLGFIPRGAGALFMFARENPANGAAENIFTTFLLEAGRTIVMAMA